MGETLDGKLRRNREGEGFISEATIETTYLYEKPPGVPLGRFTLARSGSAEKIRVARNKELSGLHRHAKPEESTGRSGVLLHIRNDEQRLEERQKKQQTCDNWVRGTRISPCIMQ